MIRKFIKYFIPYRILTFKISTKEDTFIKLLENDLYNGYNDKRIRLDYLFEGNLNKIERTLVFQRVTISPGWKSGENYKATYNVNNDNGTIELKILLNFSKTYWIFNLCLMTAIIIIKCLFNINGILILIVIGYLICNYDLQNDIINIKSDMTDLFQNHRIKTEVESKSILNI